MLAIVQNEKQLAAMESLDHTLQQGVFPRVWHPERPGDCRHDQRRINQRGQVDKDGAVGKGDEEFLRDDQGQSGLADPTGPGQGQQGHGVVEQERPSCESIFVATDEPGARDRQRR
jgi:hypothetical protein